MLPLYKTVVNYRKWENASLYFEKFLDNWMLQNNFIEFGDQGSFLKDFVESFNMARTSTGALKGHRKRQHLLASRLKAKILRTKTRFRLVLGLGSIHPFETGFIWHRNLGIPYIPASSIKGMMRAFLDPEFPWGEQTAGSEETECNIRKLFGDDKTGIGGLIIFDAFPISVPQLELDVMTSHYSDYYNDPEKNPPADYYQPTLIPFLTIAPEQDFEFIIAAREPGSGESEDMLAQGINLLRKGLESLGLGAKTAVGYGVFKDVRDVTDEIRI